MPCTPLTTPEVVYLFLRTGSACSQDLIDSVRSALIEFLTHPETAFGELWLAVLREWVPSLMGGRTACACASQ